MTPCHLPYPKKEKEREKGKEGERGYLQRDRKPPQKGEKKGGRGEREGMYAYLHHTGLLTLSLRGRKKGEGGKVNGWSERTIHRFMGETPGS